jgi:hypothetical protein
VNSRDDIVDLIDAALAEYRVEQQTVATRAFGPRGDKPTPVITNRRCGSPWSRYEGI